MNGGGEHIFKLLYLRLSFTSGLGFPNSSLNKADWHNCY